MTTISRLAPRKVGCLKEDTRDGSADSARLRLLGKLPHESGAINLIGGQLTRPGYRFIVRDIPEGLIFREIFLI